MTERSGGERAMPVVDVTLVEGRSRAEKEAMFVAVTEALCRTVDCRPDQVRIKINEVAAVDYAIAGVSMATLQAETAAPV